MVLDTSALLAVLFDEPGAEGLEAAIESDPVRIISAATLLETSVVVEARFGEAGGRELDLLIHKAAIETVPVTADQVEIARHGFRMFGKGRHAAGLNFGDCFSYSLARSLGERLLFQGDDFARTDVPSVL